MAMGAGGHLRDRDRDRELKANYSFSDLHGVFVYVKESFFLFFCAIRRGASVFTRRLWFSLYPPCCALGLLVTRYIGLHGRLEKQNMSPATYCARTRERFDVGSRECDCEEWGGA